MTVIPILLFSLLRTCPQQEAIAPCKCEVKTGSNVHCPSLKSDLVLQDVLQSLQEHSLSKLTVAGVNASTWKPDLFKGTHIEDLELQKVEVDDASFRPGRRHFQGLENSLETLHISKSFKNGHSLLNLQLDHLKHLKAAIFEWNDVPEVGNDWFSSGPTGLRTLIFEKNGIEELGNQAFSGLPNLELLAVAGNHLHEISRSVFPSPANALRSLDLAYNKLRTLPSDLFSEMPSLSDVNLDFNFLHFLQEEVFSSQILTLKSLFVEGNPFQCEKLKWICKSRWQVVSAKCSYPEDLKTKSVHQLCEK